MRRERKQRRENIGKADIKVIQVEKSSKKLFKLRILLLNILVSIYLKIFQQRFKRVIRSQLSVRMAVVKPLF